MTRRDTQVTVEISDLERHGVTNAERSIVGSLLTDTRLLAQLNGLTAEVFAAPVCRDLFRIVQHYPDLESIPWPFIEAHQREAPACDELEYSALLGLYHSDLRPLARILTDALRTRRERAVGIRLADGSIDAEEARLELAGLTEGLAGTPVTYLDMASPAPPIEWIVPGWLARREIAVLASSAGSGKSTTVADLCIAVATGRPWCSTMQLAAGQSGSVLYFDEEQGGEEVLRLFQRLYGCRPHEQLHVASMQGIVLSTEAGVSRIEAQIKELRPTLVVLDTVAQVFAGMDLSKLEEVSAAFRQLFRLRDTYGCTILLLTHYRKASKEESDLMALERVFGSVGFGGNPSTVWTAARQDGQALEVRQVKRRGARCQKIRVAYEENEAGEITLNAENLEAAEAEKDRAEVFVVRALEGHDTMRTGEITSAMVAAGFNERTGRRALNQLVVVGRVERCGHGIWRLKRDEVADEF